MINYIKNVLLAILGRPVIKEVVIERESVKEVVAKRSFLGSIDKDRVIYLKNMSESEKKEHDGSISQIFVMPAFKRELDSMIDTQVYWLGEEADGDRQHTFGKGTINGLNLVKERFELIHSTVLERNKPHKEPEDPLEKYGILGEFSTER